MQYFLAMCFKERLHFFYVLKYLQKDKVQLQASLISLEHAAKHVEKYKSIASDSGSAKRTVQHMFTRAVSDLTRSVQISDTQVALCLLNTGPEVTSDSFGYFGASFNTNYIVDHCKRKQVGSFDDGDDSDTGSAVLHSVDATDSDEDDSDSGSTVLNLVDSTDSTDSFSCAQELPEEDVEIEVPDSMLDVIIPESSSSSKSFGPAPFYKVPGKSDAKEKKKAVPVHYPTHYWFRGEQLAQLTAFEYAAMVQVVPHKITLEEEILQESNPSSQSSLVEKEAHNKPGRPARKYFRFHHLHPLHESHAQVLRSKQNTLIINGYAPKYPGP
jgi:hypothetical protein